MSSRVDTTAQHLGGRIREERRRQGLDQRSLALVANVAVRSVHRVEHGEARVRLDVLLRIALALGLELDLRHGGDR